MSTVQQLLDDINLRYKNTFTTAQKVVWMNHVQKQIFQKVRHEATPFYFTAVADQAFYPLPSDCDIKGIEQVTIQVSTSEEYEPLDYKRRDEAADEGDRFYSITERNLFLYPIPDTATAGRKVYIYYLKRPSELSDTNLNATPNLEEDFHELLILGTLERIAASRKDVVMKNNYAADLKDLLEQYEEQFSVNEPEFAQPVDVLPRV